MNGKPPISASTKASARRDDEARDRSDIRMNRPQARDGLPQPQRLRAMLVVLTGLSMSVLDGAIANIALPTIAAELRTDPASAVWVVNAYQLAVTISLLPFASLGELRGYRRVFVSGRLCSRSARSPARSPGR
jgi:DHA2 family multidrug resistance protein-like MFS transporter